MTVQTVTAFEKRLQCKDVYIFAQLYLHELGL